MTTLIQNLRARVLLGAFTRLVIPAYLIYMRNVVIKMTDNPSYDKPVPTLADMTASLDSLETKAAKAMEGSKVDRVARDMEFADSRDKARQLAAYTQLMANGDLETLLSSGFSAAAGRGPVVPVNMPLNLRLSQGANSGELNVRFARDGRSSLVFDVQNAAAPEGPYTDHPSVTKTITTLTGLTPGDMVWVRVRANGASGSSAWAGPVCKMVI